MAKTMPASGVLKAAATPAAPPARTRPSCLPPVQRPTAWRIEAPTCTVGPSRPAEAPTRRASRVSAILPKPMRSESRLARAVSSESCARRDRLRDAAALRAREEAPRERDGEREAGRRGDERDIGRDGEQPAERRLRIIRADGEADGDDADRDPAGPEDEPPLP